MAWKGSAKIKSPKRTKRDLWVGIQALRHRARRSPTTTRRSPAPSGRTATTFRTRGESCAKACATAARSASPASTTGRCPACTSARPASTCCGSTRWARSIPAVLADVEALRSPQRQGAARPRPALVPDGAPQGRAWLHPRHLGRSARPRRRTHPCQHARAARPSTSPRAASPTRPTTSRRRSPASSARTTSTTRRGSATRRRPPR